MPRQPHVDRATGRLGTELLCSDRFIHFLEAEPVREQAATLFRLLTTPRLTSLTVGRKTLWEPSLIVARQLLWGGVFVYFGHSTVTARTPLLRVNHDTL